MLKWTNNPMKQTYDQTAYVEFMNPAISQEVKTFHESFEEYKVTPLQDLKELAAHLGIGSIYIKDESYRFGLNAFKVLGASYAIGKCLAKRLNRSIQELPFSVLKTSTIRKELGELTFAATTDGNHGRGVAWTARQLGFGAVIYMPKGTTPNRLSHILDIGAKATITDRNYDDTVRWVGEEAREKNWEIIQDTAWEGYEDVPTWIMQGYSTIARETMEQLGDEKPTHIFLQAGVGAFAAVMATVFLEAYSQQPPKIVILEAEEADCFYRSIERRRVTAVTGDLKTIMAGLACGEPNPIAWEILKQYGDAFISVPDWVTAKGMRILGNPLAGDSRVISGESGAVGAGLLSVVSQEEYKALKEFLQLDHRSKVLLFSTEGDTDAAVYRDIVWNGAYPSR